MKRTLLFIACMLASLTMPAQEELTIEDIQNSGCVAETRAEKYVKPVPTIVLTKEGSILSLQLLNYESICGTEGFAVKNSMSEGRNGVPSLTVNVYPYGDSEADCICPYNVSFTLRDIENNTFYLRCWWYEGLVTLEEGKPLLLEDITLYATIDGVNYTLKKTLGTAMLTKVVEQKSKMIIPAELNYEGQTYAVKSIDYNSFRDCSSINKLDIPESVSTIYSYSFYGCKLDTLIIRGFLESRYINSSLLYGLGTDMKVFVQSSEVEKYKAIYGGPVYPMPKLAFEDVPYRPFIEEGKVWKLGGKNSGNPVQWVEYYYFDGDTIIDGKSCKQMMCQRYVSPDYRDYDIFSQFPSQSYVGAWYEEDKKVYFYVAANKQFQMKYDYSLNAYDTLQISNRYYVIGPKQMGGIKGFKGVYRDVMMWSPGYSNYNTTWLEGVGSIEGPIKNIYLGKEGYALFLMSCSVGDEVIYLNDEYEDGATSDVCEARKVRFDFTHTVKTQPKAPIKRETSDACISSSEREVARPNVRAPKKKVAEKLLYGEYNAQQLDINLDPLDETYLVRITDKTGKAVYEKTINAGNIVGLNIDISAYSEGCYTVTVENNRESFTGEFNANTTGIEEARSKRLEPGGHYIYNLQGQRLSDKPAKGMYIQNGVKRVVR